VIVWLLCDYCVSIVLLLRLLRLLYEYYVIIMWLLCYYCGIVVLLLCDSCV